MPRKPVEEAALLGTVIDHPEDDAPRLVYADWCQEDGQEARAEFIRLQVRLAAMSPADHERLEVEARTATLLRKHEAEWCESFPKWAQSSAIHRRGFVEILNLTGNDFVGKARSMFRKAPVVAARLRQVDGQRITDLRRFHRNKLTVMDFGAG